MPSIAIGIVGDELVVGDIPVPRAAETMGELIRRLQQAGIERIVIDRGVQSDEIMRLVETVSRSDSGDQTAALSRLPHIRVGRLQVDEQTDANVGDIATFRKLYDDAVKVAETLWESAGVEGIPDADAARGMVDSLAQAVAQNRTALLALTALKNYDNYTFTHMVNVSILTMGQARGVGIDGPLLREFGLAALMHDIGKVKTPNEILNKPDKLTEQEYDILKRHTVDGAQILRKTPEMPTLAPVVAFEHHLRADGTGYPSAERAAAQSRHDAVRHRRRLRRDAIAARLSAGVSHRPHPRGPAAQRRQAVRPASGQAVRAAGRASTRPAIWCASTAAKSPSCSRRMPPIRTARACAS